MSANEEPLCGPKKGDLTKAYAAKAVNSPLTPININRRNLDDYDVKVKIAFCGVCHSDMSMVKNEWGKTKSYPLVPGHEMTGYVTEVGKKVSRFRPGDRVAVSTYVDSCRKCEFCKCGMAQYCAKGCIETYASKYDKDGGATTCGGYSTHIVVDENYMFHLPETLPMDKAAPLLCAGATVYSPMLHANIDSNKKIAVAGLGGLGHMAVKIGHAMKAEVSVISTSKNKEKDAKAFGASHFIPFDHDKLEKYEKYFNVIIDTISAPHDINALLKTLTTNGTLIVVGLPPESTPINFQLLCFEQRSIMGSCICSIKNLEKLLIFCAEHSITADIETIPITKINEAYDRLSKGDVRYRFVIDMSSLE